MQFEIIGINTENYYLISFDDAMDMGKGVFFYKTPISFFDFIDMEQPEFFVLVEIELFVSRYHNFMIRDGFLEVISQDEFMNIVVNYEE